MNYIGEMAAFSNFLHPEIIFSSISFLRGELLVGQRGYLILHRTWMKTETK